LQGSAKKLKGKEIVIVMEGTQRHIGRVKWFNNKNGFGFINYNGGDIFVHHSALVVSENQFKYLVEGEYVEFTPEKQTDDTERHSAREVTGPNRGILMCETRNERSEVYNVNRSGRKSRAENVSVGNSEWKLA
jgi:CspA family cold shock protein